MMCGLWGGVEGAVRIHKQKTRLEKWPRGMASAKATAFAGAKPGRRSIRAWEVLAGMILVSATAMVMRSHEPRIRRRRRRRPQCAPIIAGRFSKYSMS